MRQWSKGIKTVILQSVRVGSIDQYNGAGATMSDIQFKSGFASPLTNMKIKHVIELLQHTMEKLGPDAPMVFSTSGEKSKDYDYGERHRQNYMVCITPYETEQHVDGHGVFHFPIRKIKPPEGAFPPMEMRPMTPEEEAAFKEAGAKWHKQTQTGEVQP